MSAIPPSSQGERQLLLTADEVGAYLRVSRNYVYDLGTSGKLPSLKFGGHRRFCQSDVEEWLAKQHT